VVVEKSRSGEGRPGHQADSDVKDSSHPRSIDFRLPRPCGSSIDTPWIYSRHVISDIFAGLVAAGTLALAAVTYRLARSTTGAVSEAYRARIDAAAHRVMPHGFTVASKCVNRPLVANADPNQFDSGIPWDLTQHGETLIGLWSYLRVRNEGAVSTLMRFDMPVGVEHWEPFADQGTAASTLERQNDDWLVLPSSIDAEVRFIWWQTARVWAAAASSRVLPQTTVTATFSDVTGGATDSCEFTFGAHVLWPHQTSDGWIVAARDMRHVVADPPELPRTRISSLQRTYPGEAQRRKPFWR
jgi:hypothetical protein